MTQSITIATHFATHIPTTTYVGLDVHKDSIDIAVADEGRGGDVRHIGTIGGDLAALDKALRKLISQGLVLHVVYEAGPCGFVFCGCLTEEAISTSKLCGSQRRRRNLA